MFDKAVTNKYAGSINAAVYLNCYKNRVNQFVMIYYTSDLAISFCLNKRNVVDKTIVYYAN